MLHAAESGEFPYDGGLRAQPHELQQVYRLILAARAVMARMAASIGPVKKANG